MSYKPDIGWQHEMLTFMSLILFLLIYADDTIINYYYRGPRGVKQHSLSDPQHPVHDFVVLNMAIQGRGIQTPTPSAGFLFPQHPVMAKTKCCFIPLYVIKLNSLYDLFTDTVLSRSIKRKTSKKVVGKGLFFGICWKCRNRTLNDMSLSLNIMTLTYI